MAKLESLSNPVIKETLALLDKKGRDAHSAFIVEGLKQFKEIPPHFKIKYVLVSASFNAKISAPKIYTVADKIFQKLAETKTPQGIIAVLEKQNYAIDAVIRKRGGPYLVLDNVQDPGNVGAILRSAWAFGVRCVFVSAGSADVYGGKVVRSAMGAVFNVPVIAECNTLEVIVKLKAAKIKVAALSLKAQKNCYDEKLSNMAFIIGNEGAGLGQDVETAADVLLKIPMESAVNSLNAATAAGIILYESSRQKNLLHP